MYPDIACSAQERCIATYSEHRPPNIELALDALVLTSSPDGILAALEQLASRTVLALVQAAGSDDDDDMPADGRAAAAVLDGLTADGLVDEYARLLDDLAAARLLPLLQPALVRVLDRAVGEMVQRYSGADDFAEPQLLARCHRDVAAVLGPWAACVERVLADGPRAAGWLPLDRRVAHAFGRRRCVCPRRLW